MTIKTIVFGNNLKYLRTRAGLTQDDMLTVLGIKRTTWANYENGSSTPYITELMKISDFWGIDETNLLRNEHLKKDVEQGKLVPRNLNTLMEPGLHYKTSDDELLDSLEEILIRVQAMIHQRKSDKKATEKSSRK
ncbi:MAG: helix-turn-helix domain-containing protein [Cytophagaceae bacterium]|jgi:transcriptional regulator with XRE-family HTH domain|nr:helix-turn-helix domain-containing protein [Cytophagaceae bacterium]